MARKTPTPRLPDDVSLEASDCYITPRWVVELVECCEPEGIDLDPFHHPRTHVRARHRIDARGGGNAYVDPWPGLVVFANGPYSKRYPQSTARRCAWARARGQRVWNLGPAAPGSDYWARYVWPWASAIVWLGRLGFEAGEDVYNKKGELVCRQGHTSNQNRTEIAMAYAGDDPDLVRSVFGRFAEVTIPRR